MSRSSSWTWDTAYHTEKTLKSISHDGFFFIRIHAERHTGRHNGQHYLRSHRTFYCSPTYGIYQRRAQSYRLWRLGHRLLAWHKSAIRRFPVCAVRRPDHRLVGRKSYPARYVHRNIVGFWRSRGDYFYPSHPGIRPRPHDLFVRKYTYGFPSRPAYNFFPCSYCDTAGTYLLQGYDFRHL